MAVQELEGRVAGAQFLPQTPDTEVTLTHVDVVQQDHAHDPKASGSQLS